MPGQSGDQGALPGKLAAVAGALALGAVLCGCADQAPPLAWPNREELTTKIKSTGARRQAIEKLSQVKESFEAEAVKKIEETR